MFYARLFSFFLLVALASCVSKPEVTFKNYEGEIFGTYYRIQVGDTDRDFQVPFDSVFALINTAANSYVQESEVSDFNLKGVLKDENGSPVSNATIEVAYEGSDEITHVKVNGDDGKYAAIVKTEKKQDVMVTVKKEGHAFDSKLIAKEDFGKKDVTIRGKDLDVKKLVVGEAYTINDILYATSSAVLSDKSKFILKGFARFLIENETIKVGIQGHTDDVGDDNRNLKLSEDRALSVKQYLVSLGVDANRLTSKGFGETMPNVPNDSEQNRAKNRRTDFVIEGM